MRYPYRSTRVYPTSRFEKSERATWRTTPWPINVWGWQLACVPARSWLCTRRLNLLPMAGQSTAYKLRQKPEVAVGWSCTRREDDEIDGAVTQTKPKGWLRPAGRALEKHVVAGERWKKKEGRRVSSKGPCARSSEKMRHEPEMKPKRYLPEHPWWPYCRLFPGTFSRVSGIVFYSSESNSIRHMYVRRYCHGTHDKAYYIVRLLHYLLCFRDSYHVTQQQPAVYTESLVGMITVACSE